MRASSALALCVVLATVPSPAFAAEPGPFLLTASSGVGPTLGLAGAGVELGYRPRGGFGLTIEGGAGVAASIGAHVWFPGQKLQLGLGGAEAVSWSRIRPEPSHCGEPRAGGGDPGITFVAADVALAHDIGDVGAWGLRYGLSGGIFASGCVAAILPMPTLSLGYRF